MNKPGCTQAPSEGPPFPYQSNYIYLTRMQSLNYFNVWSCIHQSKHNYHQVMCVAGQPSSVGWILLTHSITQLHTHHPHISKPLWWFGLTILTWVIFANGVTYIWLYCRCCCPIGVSWSPVIMLLSNFGPLGPAVARTFSCNFVNIMGDLNLYFGISPSKRNGTLHSSAI